MKKRLRELDFLRGIAIILVLFRHQIWRECMYKMGWIGVDLFFVLSGFLVSGLLFREYQQYGNLEAKRFLIRRGFKIYPLYYLSYIAYIPIILPDFKLRGFLADMTFTQNYLWDFGYAYAASWSLAVEEHFYFGLILVLWIVLRKKLVKLDPPATSLLGKIEKSILFMMFLCILFRIANNVFYPDAIAKNLTMTHLKIDSLLAGVLVAYLYYFRIDFLRTTFKKYKTILLIIAPLGLIWTPFLEPAFSFFVKTIGFTFLYLSFSIILISFLLSDRINQVLNRIFTRPVVDLVSKIGFCSYSIYLIHIFFDIMWARFIYGKHLFYMPGRDLYINPTFNFVVTSALSITTGMLLTYSAEQFFLKIRDKYYPSRSAMARKMQL